MNKLSYSEIAANNNIGPALDGLDNWFKADITAVRELLANDIITDWHCILHADDDASFIPTDNPMRLFNDYWANGSADDRLICDMSCPSTLGNVLDVLPADVELQVMYDDNSGYPRANSPRCTVWIRPSYDQIAYMGLDRFSILCNSAG